MRSDREVSIIISTAANAILISTTIYISDGEYVEEIDDDDGDEDYLLYDRPTDPGDYAKYAYDQFLKKRRGKKKIASGSEEDSDMSDEEDEEGSEEEHDF